ncbi:hybrid sensor histidine kinase/response regulator, partial [Bacillus thuringiensis]
MVFEEGRAVDFIYHKVNAAFERITGLVGVKGRSVHEVLPGLEEYWFRVLGRVATEGVMAQFDREVSQLGRWYSVEAVRIGAPEKRQVAVLLFDISARKRVETDLAESEARFSALADGLPMPVWVLDDLGHVRFANTAFTTFFGITQDSDLGPRWWRKLLHPVELAAFEYELQAALVERRELHI